MEEGVVTAAERLVDAGMTVIFLASTIYLFIDSRKERKESSKQFQEMQKDTNEVLKDNAVAMEKISDSIDRNTMTIDFLGRSNNFIKREDDRT